MAKTNSKPLAFMSYAHIDDETSRNMLTKVRDELKKEIIAQSGSKYFEIYFDRENLETSQLWKERINQALDDATFLIPIITPSFFNSDECRKELKRFIARENKLNSKELVFPIYFIEVGNYSIESVDELVREMAKRQYADFRDFRLGSLRSKRARIVIHNLGKQIIEKAGINKELDTDGSIKSNSIKKGGKKQETDFEEKIILPLFTPEKFYEECKKIHETNPYVSVLSKTPGLIISSERNLTDFRRDYFKTISMRLSEGEGNYNLRYFIDKDEFAKRLTEIIKKGNYDELHKIKDKILYLSKYNNLDLRYGNTIPLTGSVIGGSRTACIGFKEEYITKITEGIRITVPEMLKIIIYQYNELFDKSERLNDSSLDKIIEKIKKGRIN